jgi:hypothetical protein
MEKFIKLKEDVSLRSLADEISSDRIIVLRESKTTGTIQVKLVKKMSSKKIREAFQPYTVVKIFDEFPYPVADDGFIDVQLTKLKRLFA